MRWSVIPLMVVAAGCSDVGTGTGDAAWLSGTVNERFDAVARHLRGFDMAMVEVGYRYTELYWAGQDGNWPYATYQLDKIETAMANGLERRPKRAASAKMLAAGTGEVRAARS